MSQLIKAAVLHSVNDFSIEKISLPELQKNWVEVTVKSAGICGSDLVRVYKSGMYEKDLIPGHEFSGIVSYVNSGDEVLLNKRVAVFPLIPCKECIHCKNEDYNLCIKYNYLGSRTHGGFAEKVLVPKENLLILPENVSFDHAACIEPLAVAYHAINKLETVSNKKILILGLGPIGQLVGHLSQLYDASEIIGIDRNKFKHEIALKMGYSSCVESCDELSSSEYDIIIDCAGNGSLLQKSLSLLKKKGTLLLVANYSSDICLSPSDMSHIMRGEIKMISSWNSLLFGKKNDWQAAVDLLESSKIDISPLVTHRYPFDKIIEVFDLIFHKSIPSIKTIIYLE